jgi:O-antigen ligase/cytochrome c-type biogenesis protein CcmH/NrfG
LKINKLAHYQISTLLILHPTPYSARMAGAVWICTTLIIFPLCLDWQLVPRFVVLSGLLLAGIAMLWQSRRQAPLSIDWLDAWLGGWFLFNLAGIGWSFSASEGIFYALKTGLLLVAYWFFRQIIQNAPKETAQVLQRSTLFLSGIALLVTGCEIGQVALQNGGIGNEYLYDNVRLLYGNKSLTADFLFFLLIFNGAFRTANTFSKTSILYRIIQVLLLLVIVLLQTRTVYLALAGAGVVLSVLTFFSSDKKQWQQWKKPMLWLVAGVVIALVGLTRINNSLANRLNPMTYLDSDTANERRFVWYKTDLLNQQHYWWGVGTGSWKFRWPENSMEGGYRMEQLQVSFTRAHNDYVEIRAELGIMGALWFCSLFLLVAGCGLVAWRRAIPNSEAKRGLPWLLSGLFGYCIIQYFDFPRERMELQVVLALFFAWMAHNSRAVSDEKMDKSAFPAWPQWHPSPILRRAWLFLMTGICLFSLVTGIFRLIGEMQNVRMLQAANRRDNQAVIRAAQAAQNPFYQYDDVNLPLPWYEGSAWHALGRMDKATEAFERAYALNPWSYQTINNYATSMVQAAPENDTRTRRAAVLLYEKAASINPRHHDAKLNLAYTLWQLGDSTAARAWINRIDTIRLPQNDNDRAYNRFVLEQIAAWKKMSNGQ